jgi:hypothetical protein
MSPAVKTESRSPSFVELARNPLQVSDLTMIYLLPSTPAWAEVQRAVQLLKQKYKREIEEEERSSQWGATQPQRELLEERQALEIFMEQFEKSSELLANVLLIALALGQLAGVDEEEIPLRRGLAALTAVYSPQSSHDWQTVVEDVATKIQEYCQFNTNGVEDSEGKYSHWFWLGLGKSKQESAGEPVPRKFNPWKYREWIETVQQDLHLLESADLPMVENCQQQAWENWFQPLCTEDFDRSQSIDLFHLVSGAAFKSPATMLQLRHEDMTLRDWSRMFIDAYFGSHWREDPQGLDYYCPKWAGLIALGHLGFSDAYLGYMAGAPLPQKKQSNCSLN